MRRSLNKILRKIGYEIVRYSRFPSVLEQELKNDPDFFFVQIGANDGVRFDNLYNFVTNNNCKGLVVEPIKDYFERLALNYKDYPNIIPVNVAIHKEDKKATIYRVDPKRLHELPVAVDGIASFLPQHHQLMNTPSEYMISEEVACMHLMEMFDQYKVTKINLLQIDTEGYDAEIIKLIDFERIKPSIIKYEHHGISDQEEAELQSMLTKIGYEVFREHGGDSFAVRKPIN